MITSRYFSRNQLKGLLRAGQVVAPGTETSPSFAATGCLRHIDRAAAFLGPDDLQALRLVLDLFRWTPKWKIRLILALAARNRAFPGPLGAGLRMLEIGIKGTILSLYYSNLTGPGFKGRKVHDVIGWDARVNLAPDEAEPVGEELVNLHEPAPEDIGRAFALAREAQPIVRGLGLGKRLEYIANLKELIIARREEIVERIQKDTGKSRTDALTSEIFGTLDHLDYLQKHAPKVLADRKVPTPLALMGKKSRIYFEPLGVVLTIAPWNYPFYQAVVPLTSAFAVGNAVIHKPASATPLTGLVEELLDEVGFEPGWVQVVYGEGGRLGDLLVDQRPDKIFFIGSGAVGRRLMEQAARRLIPVELELGGKDPMIVFADADLKRAAAGAVWGAFTNTGQSCTSVERLYVEEPVYEEFKALLIKETEQLRQGQDPDGSLDIGPMTTGAQVGVIAGQIEEAVGRGARLLTGTGWDRVSPVIPPMVVEGSTPEMRLNQEETFGPVLPIFSFNGEAEAVGLADQGEFGLSASVWTADLERAGRVARALVTGNVSINNVMLTEGNHALPFGGAKESGIGRYKGEFGLYCFANVKSVLIDKNGPKIEANWFPYTRRKYELFSKLTAELYTPGVWSIIKGALTGMRLEGYAKKLAKKGRS